MLLNTLYLGSDDVNRKYIVYITLPPQKGNGYSVNCAELVRSDLEAPEDPYHHAVPVTYGRSPSCKSKIQIPKDWPCVIVMGADAANAAEKEIKKTITPDLFKDMWARYTATKDQKMKDYPVETFE